MGLHCHLVTLILGQREAAREEIGHQRRGEVEQTGKHERAGKSGDLEEVEARIEYLEKKEATSELSGKYIEELQSLRLYIDSLSNIELPEVVSCT